MSSTKTRLNIAWISRDRAAVYDKKAVACLGMDAVLFNGKAFLGLWGRGSHNRCKLTYLFFLC
jgi:hypothetical protein